MKLKSFPFYRQLQAKDCGPACLRMVAKHYGKEFSLNTLREKSYIDKQGVSMMGIVDAAEAIGLRATAADAAYEALVEEKPFPAIVHWRSNHFVVLYKIDKKERAYIADPAHGLIRLSKEEFLKGMHGPIVDGEKEGTILFFEPNPDFYQQEKVEGVAKKRGLIELAYYMLPYKRHIFQLMLGMGAASLMALAFAFLNQGMMDIGITGKNLGFINLVLIAQLMLFVGSTVGDVSKSWIMLHMGTRINIAMMSDFLAKLTRLPMSYFDGKMTGDVMQRMGDLSRVQSFITSTVLSSVMMVLNLIVYTIMLVNYNMTIFYIFFIGSAVHTLWILLFLKKRKELDYTRFENSAGNQSGLITFIQGMQDIKLHNAEKQNRWKWERIQVKLFKVSMRSLALGQYQSIGSSIIHKLKNIFIMFVSAQAVIAGDITLGMMVTIQFILGNLEGPISAMVGFVTSFQDANISLERIGEVFEKEDEETNPAEKINDLHPEASIHLENVSFQYGAPSSRFVLKNINLSIPRGKVTAIVGSSGSGKTTLLKLLLKYYPPTEGAIKIGAHDMKDYRNSFWRDQCGVVMQNGFMFSDTIAKNIAVAEDNPDKQRLLYAVKIANIQSFIEELALTYNTRIGSDGIGVSGGQRQRILIARAVYKSPEFFFFDEATSSLDAENERIIMENLSTFLKGKTALVIAHRLSTVRDADNIIFLDKGELKEQGTHEELTKAKGAYYALIKNQLELGT